MYEKVNPSHPDKVADRIAGALIDYAYIVSVDPRIAVEVLIGHGNCHIIAETSTTIPLNIVSGIVARIANPELVVDYKEVPQDEHLAGNQSAGVKCGDNGIFRGVPINEEETKLINIAKNLYDKYPYDGKFIIDTDADKLIICQSNVDEKELREFISSNVPYSTNLKDVVINPLGYWTGGVNVDSGATNRKLGSDMGRAVTGGGLMGKDLSKSDVSVNIYAHLMAQKTGRAVELNCAIGDSYVDGLPYRAIVEIARDYIFNKCGGFEKFAEWGLLR